MKLRPYPPPRAAPDVLSQGEIRYWIRELLYNPDLGWSHCKLCLARYLEIDLPGLRSKIRTTRTQARFRGGEQRRFSVRIRQLLAGRVVPRRIRSPSGHWKWEATMTDDPKPLRQPGRMRVDLASGRVEFVPPTAPDFTPALPSFEKALGRFLSQDNGTGGP